MKKIVKLSILCLVFLLLFVGCGSKKADKKLDKDLKEKAEYAIKLLEDGKYDEFCDELVDESKKSTITSDSVKKNAEKILSNTGDFVEFTSNIQATNKDNENKKIYNAFMTAKYDNKNIFYIMSFNKDMKLIDYSVKEKEETK